MSQVLSTSSDADSILRQMREVRAELRDDVQDLVSSAHQMSDWTQYVKAYPWLCVGAAAALGYFIVPQRTVVVRPDAEALVELAKKHKLFVNAEAPPQKKRGGLAAELVSVAAAALLQGGLKILSRQVTEAIGAAHFAPHKTNGQPGGVAP